MTRVAVQPCGDSVARTHYVDTIRNLVPAERVLPHLTEDQVEQFSEACGDFVAVWGVTRGKRNQNRTKWAKLRSGDVALLYRDRKIFSQGRIALCLHNEPLAKELWSVNEDGETWEFVYFLDELEETEVSVERLNSALGYKSNYVVQGFNVYEGGKADELLSMLEIEPDVDLPEDIGDDPESLQTTLANIANLDLPNHSKARAEARVFRKHLFKGQSRALCALCGRELPRNLLVAAHIKPRASCTDEERRDLSVVMSACRLGCDELFERGYITVEENGTILLAETMGDFPDLRHSGDILAGRECNAHDSHTEKYFDWHRKHPRRYLK